MGLGHSPSIAVDGLVFYIDPNNPNCYPGFGNTLYNIVNTSIGGTFVGYTSNPIDNTENRTIYFDGSDDYIDFGSSSALKLTDNFTLSAWVKSRVYDDRAILGNFGPSSNYSGFNLCVQPNNKFAFLTGSNPSATYLYADNTYLLNTWYHITGVRRNGTNYLYINGIAQTSTNTQLVATSAQNFYFGKWYSNLTGYYHSGQIGIVSLYNRSLTATEILQNYNATKKKYSPEENIVTNGLVLNIDPANPNSYPGTGNTIYDLSGSGKTGVFINGPVYSSVNNGAIVLDGTNDYITFSNTYASSFGISSDATVSIWAKINRKNQYTSFVGFYNPASGNKSDFGMDVTSSNTIRLWKNDSQADTYASIINDKWVNYVITSDNSTAKLYRDCVLMYTLNASGGINNNRMFAIGYNWDVMINASVSQTLIYNKTLTQQEILQNYNATKKRFVNPLPPVRNGLVLELDAGQRSSYPGTGNTWYDLSGNSLNGALTNGPTFSGIGATSSISFDGTNDYVDCGYNSTINSSTQFTIECWYKSSNISVEGVLFSTNTYGSTPANGYHMEIYQSKLLFQVFPSTSSVQSSITLSNNVWYHLVSTYSSGTINLYVNTVSGGSGTYTFNSSTGNLLLGRYPQGQFSLNGQMSSIRFYNRVLSAYEVKQNFDFYRTRYNI